MNSKSKFLFSGAILTLCFTGVPAHAHTVNFSGKIISETCQIADNSGNVDVNFGSVNMDTLKSHEQTTAQTPFQIHLTGCRRHKTSASVWRGRLIPTPTAKLMEYLL